MGRTRPRAAVVRCLRGVARSASDTQIGLGWTSPSCKSAIPAPLREPKVAEERKYREDEISEIFALATTAGGASLPVLADQEGLTLGELQEVGREVGIPPVRVAVAAATFVARSESLPRLTLL